jgi:hypothetical protein
MWLGDIRQLSFTQFGQPAGTCGRVAAQSRHHKPEASLRSPHSEMVMVRRMAFVDWLEEKMVPLSDFYRTRFGSECPSCHVKDTTWETGRIDKELTKEWQDRSRHFEEWTYSHRTCGHTWKKVKKVSKTIS